MGFIVAFLFFTQSGEPIYVHLDLFYEICDTVNEYNQRQTHYLSLMFLTQFGICKEVTEKFIL